MSSIRGLTKIINTILVQVAEFQVLDMELKIDDITIVVDRREIGALNIKIRGFTAMDARIVNDMEKI